jgi:hypothetical protein
VPEARVHPEVQGVIAPLTAVTVVGLFRAADGSLGQVGSATTARLLRSGTDPTRGEGWQTIGLTTGAPFVVAWDTTPLANGLYELRAVCAASPADLLTPVLPSATERARQDDDGGCFIATAAFGAPLAPQVQVLRDFRERYLQPTALGRWLVHRYYAVSPAIADVIRDRPALQALARLGLTPVVWSVQGVMAGSETQRRLLGCLILLGGVGMGWRVYHRRGQLGRR